MINTSESIPAVAESFEISQSVFIAAAITTFVIIGIPLINFIRSIYNDKLISQKEKDKIDQEQEAEIRLLRTVADSLKERIIKVEDQYHSIDNKISREILKMDTKVSSEISKIDHKIDILIEKVIDLAAKQ